MNINKGLLFEDGESSKTIMLTIRVIAMPIAQLV